MKRFGSKIFGFAVVGLSALFAAKAHAVMTCPDPHQPAGTAWCDADTTRFLNDTMCVAEPVTGPTGSTVDEEVVGSGVCILGKFKTVDKLQRLADFIVAYDFPADPLMGPSGVFVPELQTIAGSNEFMTTVPLDEQGVFDITINGRVLNDDGSFQDVNIGRRVLRVAVPHMTVTKARVAGSSNDCAASDPSCFGVHEDTVDPGVPGHPAHQIQLTPPAGGRAPSVELCVQNHDDEAQAGNSVLVRAINTVTDNSSTPAREIVVDANCAAPGETLCQPATDSFCPGGFKVNVPLGNGRNAIDLFVDNLITGYDVGAGERVSIDAFNVDLKGPDLCVNYLNDVGHKIDDVDGKALLPTESTNPVLDVALGKCGSDPETVTATPPAGCDPENPPACVANSPVCVQKDNAHGDDGTPQFVALCDKDVAGKKHYQMRLKDLHFPVSTNTIRATDNTGNQTVETHFFGVGNVRPLFDKNGQLDVKDAMVPKGVGGFIDAGFINNELLPVILKAVNSDKFKNDLFFKLLDPRQPGDEEISCLKSIEDQLNCTMDHLASKSRVVAIKAFCDKGGCVNNIGQIEIPSFYLMAGNRIRMQLKIDGLHGRAEMYTMQFEDADNDGIADTEDDDADNDGICDRPVISLGKCTDANHDGVCDEEVSISGSQGKGLNASGKCVLDKTVPRDRCPDDDAKTEKNYFGCSDQDDDNDGIPDDHDLPGRIVQDPDFGTYVLPLLFQVKQLALNLDIQFQKDHDGRLHVQITPPPDRDMVEAISDSGNLIEFDCDKDVSEIYQGGHKGDDGNGRNLWIDTEACKALKDLSNGLNGNGSFVQGAVISTSQFLGLVDRKKRQNEGTNQQLLCTLQATAICSLPKRIETKLADFDDQKVSALSFKLQDNRFHMDFFAPLGQSDVFVDSRGLGFGGKGLLLPAGVSDANDEAERNAKDFLNTLPAEFKNNKFGPVSKYGTGAPVDPIVASMEMGDEINLALNEESINSGVHSTMLLLWALANKQGEGHQMLDFDAKNLRENFKMGIPDIGHNSSQCKDKDGNHVDGNSYKCFPFPLNIENVLGPTTLTYVDFDGDGVAGTPNDAKTPMLIRNGVNPLSPTTAKIVSVSPVESWGGTGPVKAPVVIAELEVALGSQTMSLFEEKVASWTADPIAGTGEIKDWCDSDRYPGANQAKCTAGHKLPIVTFALSGRAFVTLMLTVNEDGIIHVEAGLSAVQTVEGKLDLDKTKTDIQFNVIENNTIVPDNEIAAAMKRQVGLILPNYLFGDVRDIRVDVPSKLPLEAYCATYKDVTPDICACVMDPTKDDCDTTHSIQNAWDEMNLDRFGIEGVTLVHPLLGVSDDEEDPIRFLTIGMGVDFDLKK